MPPGLDEATSLHVVDNGQLVLVVSWARMLAEVRSCLAEVDDSVGLENLEQFADLCDRADREAMLPFTDGDFATATAWVGRLANAHHAGRVHEPTPCRLRLVGAGPIARHLQFHFHRARPRSAAS